MTSSNSTNLEHLALEAIANMTVDETTDHAQLSALCIGIAKAALQKTADDRRLAIAIFGEGVLDA